MFESVEEVQQRFRDARYIASRRVSTVVFLAARMGRPVLIEGPAGVGKTELAKTLSDITARPLIRLQCYEGLDEGKALYEWKYAKQLLYTQLLRERIGELIADAPSLPDAVAKIAGLKAAPEAFKKIAEAEAAFASRGDDSGTNKAELKLWQDAGVDPRLSSGKWYLETGTGMGATLNTAVGKQAYTVTDRGTWLSFANKDDFKILVEGDPKLFNQYGVILVNPAKHPNVKAAEGQAFIDWLISPEGQAAIASYKIDGQQLFFPNAR